MIRITELIRTIRLYGRSSYQRRITGRFALSLGVASITYVDIFEGHVNKGGRPQRLISFADRSGGMLSEFLKSNMPSQIEIMSGDETVHFAIERLSTEVIGVSDEQSTEVRFRGQVEWRSHSGDLLTLYETDSAGPRRFYIDASVDVLGRAEESIRKEGSIELLKP